MPLPLVFLAPGLIHGPITPGFRHIFFFTLPAPHTPYYTSNTYFYLQ